MTSFSDNDHKSYRILRPLDELYQCTISLAEWSGVEGFVKQITIWHVLPELCTDPHSVDVLFRGLRKAAGLSASAGAQILDVWRDGQQIAVSVEHVSGLTMAQAMEKAAQNQQLLPLDAVLTTLIEVVHSLEQAHDSETRAGSVIHGSLSPEVILFGYEGAVKVTGFGFADFLPLVSPDGSWSTWRGRCYQPPERLRSGPVTPETDVFSIGAILLEAATGIPPYGSTDPQDLLSLLRTASSVLPPDREEIADDLVDVIRRACYINPSDRYPSMNELAADLYRIQIERRRNSSTPPIRIREMIRTLESPSQRLAKVESKRTQAAPSAKSQVLKAPTFTKISNPPPVTMPSSPLVGRTTSLRAISQALAGTNSGRGGAILITGEEGMGRSRLLSEVALRLAGSKRKLAWLHVQCLYEERDSRYSAVLRMLASAAGLPPENPLGDLADQAERLRAFGIESETVTAIKGLLGHGTPPEPVRLAGLLCQAVIQCLSSLSWEQTTIVAWDDVQWTDQLSIDCLGELVAQLPLMPVVVLMTGEQDSTVPFDGSVTRFIELGPLSSQESEQLVVARCKANRIDRDLMADLFERTYGNPALLEELIEILIESDQLEIERKTVRLKETHDKDILDINEGVKTRFKTLSNNEATVTVVAALAGPALSEQVLIKATNLNKKQVKRAVDELQRRKILKSRRRGLAFPHKRIREATLRAVGPQRLFALRADVARAILEEAEDTKEGWRNHAADLLIDAGDQPAAAQVLIEAASRKEELRDLSGAAEQYSRALELSYETQIFGIEETLELCLKAGNAALHSLRLDLGERALRKAVDLSERINNPGAGADARVMLCRLLARQGNLKEAMDVVQEAIPLAEQSGDDLTLARVYMAIAESYQQWGEYGPDFEYIEPALRLASESGDLLQLGRSLQLAVTHAAGVGKYNRTEDLLKRARAIAEKSKDPLLSCQLIRAEALLDVFSGRIEEGLEQTLIGLELAHKNGLYELEVIFLHNAGDAHFRCGRYQEALYYFSESHRKSTAARFDRLTEGNEMYIGFLETTYLQQPTGWDRLNQATENARVKGRIWNVTQGHLLQGQALLFQGDTEGAISHFEEALRLGQASGVAFFVQESQSLIQEAQLQYG